MSEKYIIKVLTLGDATVGKSSIVIRYSDNKFSETLLSTIGVDSKRKIVKINGEKVRVSIWDTAGQEKFQNIVKQYYKGANGVLLIYDITCKKSFDRVYFWYNDLKNNVNIEEILVCLVGNKIDLESNREVKKEVAEKYAKDKNMMYFEVSAKSGDGIKKLFNDVTNCIMDKILKMNEKDDNNEINPRMSFLDNYRPNEKKCC